jgi:phage tail sheath protein FI
MGKTSIPHESGHQSSKKRSGHQVKGFSKSGKKWWVPITHWEERISHWPYLSADKKALFIGENIYNHTQWVVFEPNDEHLWSRIRSNVDAFMKHMYSKGAFKGTTSQEAYFVKCDSETTTQYDIDHGIVNIVVGFAPLKPAEFVVITIQQVKGQDTR